VDADVKTVRKYLSGHSKHDNMGATNHVEDPDLVGPAYRVRRP
jgi:hypothetical protein